MERGNSRNGEEKKQDHKSMGGFNEKRMRRLL
jgi:hypothetical protein